MSNAEQIGSALESNLASHAHRVTINLAMSKLEESRREWEQEIRDVQHNVTPEEGLRAIHILAKKSSDALIPDVAHLIRFVLGAVLLGLGVIVLSSGMPHRMVVSIAALAAGAYLEYSVFWSKG